MGKQVDVKIVSAPAGSPVTQRVSHSGWVLRQGDAGCVCVKSVGMSVYYCNIGDPTNSTLAGWEAAVQAQRFAAAKLKLGAVLREIKREAPHVNTPTEDIPIKKNMIFSVAPVIYDDHYRYVSVHSPEDGERSIISCPC